MFTSPILIALASAAIGAAPFLLSLLSSRVNNIPGVQDVKADYPIINVVLKAAADNTSPHTIPGLVADAAYLLWSERDVSDEKAKELTAAAVKHFRADIYKDTVFSKFDASIIEKGHQLAKQLKVA